LEPYSYYLEKFNQAVNNLRSIALMPQDVDTLESEDDELAFVQAFREILRLKNILVSFADFKFTDTTITEQTFENYKGKYLDIYDKVKSDHTKEKVSVLEEVDFELELVRRDEVNVSYILRLIARMVGADEAKQREIRKTVMDTMAN